MSNKDAVLFIAEGSPSIGFGHISRCITIAHQFKDHGYEVFFLFKEGGYFKSEVEEQFKVHVVHDFTENSYLEFEEFITDKNISTVIIDLIEKEYLELCWLRDRFEFLKIVSITLFLFDFDTRYEHLSFFPDMELKSNSIINTKKGKFHLLSGPEYLVFREEFRNLNKEVREKANKVLVTMGGTDPLGISLKVIQELKQVEGLIVTLLLSKLSPHYKILLDEINSSTSAQINLIEKSAKISKLMLGHDIIVLNGGLTRYEACLAKTPFIAIAIHKTQFEISEKLTRLGVGINLGIFEKLGDGEIRNAVSRLLQSHNVRKQMSEKMDGVFDGYGATRIFKQIIDYRIKK